MSLDSSDETLAEKLKREDPEQFHTLVRMHLSFVLDLNTDETDCVEEKSKIRALKWTFAKKVKSMTKGVMEGAPLTQEGICQVYQLIEYLSLEENIIQEGIFRRTGKLTRQQELKSLLNQGTTLNLHKSQFSVHDCASVLKSFLAELPEPLLTEAHLPAYCQLAELCTSPCNEAKLLRALQLLLLRLPSENCVLLRDLLQLLHSTASHETSNKMSAHNLATLFTPHLLCPRRLTPEAFHANSQTMSRVVAFMIGTGTDLLRIPPKLATDIRAYWAKRESRRQVTPHKELDESIDGTATAATVFTFLDQENTSKVYNSNTTEAALAELYAHVQSLPESSHKRKLIKQYNKGNGQGTPVQNKHLRSKSLGDSIKKHIFNKSGKQHRNQNGEGQVNLSRSASREKIHTHETMMTPRSRKPVLALSGTNICQLANFSSSVSPDEFFETGRTWGLHENKIPTNVELSAGCIQEPKLSTIGENSPQELESTASKECSSGDSLTSTFRSYLFSRSVLTASPVDLSFSSRTGDFDTGTSSDIDVDVTKDELTDSLLYCLDGNQPPTDTFKNKGEGSDSSTASVEKDLCASRKRSVDGIGKAMPCHNTTNKNIKNGMNDYSIDEYLPDTILLGQKLTGHSIVHETSL